MFEAYLSNGEKGALAQKYDRMGRTWFPLAFVISVAFVSVFGWYKNADPDADTQKLPPAVAPPGGKMRGAMNQQTGIWFRTTLLCACAAGMHLSCARRVPSNVKPVGIASG